MRLVTPLFSQFLAVLRDNPSLARYRKQIIGSCCRIPGDVALRQRILNFLVRMPEYQEVLGPLTIQQPGK